MPENEKDDCSQSQPTEVKFVAGGNVQAGDGYYISREADGQLLELCKTSKFANVLAPRQLGKTSLVNHTAECLFEQGIQFVIIDLSPLGKRSTEEIVWYGNLLHEIGEQLEINFDFDEWKKKYDDLGATKMLELFLRDLVLSQIKEPVVIFLDEIDSTINLTFKDDFFAAIRHFYQLRTQHPEFHRLSFVLIGVATPSDLISDTARTPFNLGERVSIKDFSLEEALPLAKGFELPDEHAREVLGWVMKWTNGHPYLTMRLCKIVAEKKRQSWTAGEINKLVEFTFLGEEGVKDNNIQFVSKMLLERIPAEVEPGELLVNYQDVWRGKSVTDNEYSIIKSHLKLSGIVHEVNGFLKVRNEIYSKIFNDKWIKEHLPETWVRLQYRTVKRNAIVALSALVLILLATTAYALYQSQQATEKKVEAETSADIATRQTNLATENAYEAIRQTELAREAKDRAEKSEEETRLALDNEKKAKKQIEGLVIQEREARKKSEVARADAEKQESIARGALEKAEKAQKVADQLKVEAQNERDKATEQKNVAIKATEDLARQNIELADARKKAEENEKLAKASEDEAKKLRKITQARFYGAKSEQLVQTDSYISALLATEAINVFDGKNGKYPVEVNANQPLYQSISKLPQPISKPKSLSFQTLDNVNTFVVDSTTEEIITGKNNILSGKGFDTTLSINDDENPKIIYPSNLEKILFLKTSRSVLTLNSDNNVYIFSPDGPLNPSKLPIKLDSNNKNLWSNFTFTEKVNDIAVSPLDERIAVAYGNKIQILKNVKSNFIKQGEPLRRTLSSSSSGAFLSVAFSENDNGRYLASADCDEGRIWDATDNSELAHTEGGDGRVISAFFSPNGLYLATTSMDENVRLWSISDGKQIVKPSQITSPIKYTPKLKERTTQASISNDAVFRQAKFNTLSVGVTCKQSSAIVRFSPDSKVVAVVNNTDITLTALDGSPLPKLPVNSEITDINFSPNSFNLAVATRKGEIQIWDIAKGKMNPLDFKAGDNTALFSADGQNIIVANNYSTQIWDVKSKSDDLQPLKLTANILSSAYNRTTNLLVTVNSDSIKITNTKNSDQYFLPLKEKDVRMLTFSENGKFLLVVGNTGSARLYKLESNQFKINSTFNFPSAADRINYAALNNDGSLVVAAAGNSSYIYDTKSGKALKSLSTSEGFFDKVLFNPQNKQQLVTVTNSAKIQIWNFENLSNLINLDFPKDIQTKTTLPRVSNISFSPNGKLLAVSIENNIVVFNLEEKTSLPPFQLRSENNNSAIAWSEDSNYLAVANGNQVSVLLLNDLFAQNNSTKPEIKEFIRLRNETIKPNETSKSIEINDLFFVSEQKTDSKYLVIIGNDGSGNKRLWKPDDLIKDTCERIFGGEIVGIRKYLEEDWKVLFSNEEENPFPDFCSNR
jgi:WD40 repeat protein